ncbi:helix-turn-helix domain-containing protein [Corynebacterium cystitidis]|uniref:helix-turn-helix domain-containing protein n=1 Tax=Corynebacterium cystitidis TaxID=35757 RepID=UPI00211F002A|nr:helix-turn-helix transcriptional regulator [Corynebacterium cystitidis]
MRAAVPKEVYPQWPDVDPEKLPATYKTAHEIRTRLLDVVDDYIEMGWASSVSDFAKRCGVNHSVVSRWLSGEGWPSMAVIITIEVAVSRPIWVHQPIVKRGRKGKGHYDYPAKPMRDS